MEGADSQCPRSTLETQYLASFVLDAAGVAGHDTYALVHSNRLVVVGLALSHVAVQYPSGIASVAFPSSVNSPALCKRRKRLKHCCKDTLVAEICCADGTVFKFRPGIAGKLMEVNDLLLQHPALVRLEPGKSGWIAILEPSGGRKRRKRSTAKASSCQPPPTSSAGFIPAEMPAASLSATAYKAVLQERIQKTRQLVRQLCEQRQHKQPLHS